MSIAALFALVVALTIGASTASAFAAQQCKDLIAGKGGPTAGTVCVTQVDATSIQVVFTTVGYVMTEAQLAVETNLNDIPQSNGNPIPGQFDYKYVDAAGFTTHTFSVTGLTTQQYYIAAHAKVWNGASETVASAVSGTGTTQTDSTFVPDGGAALLACEPNPYSLCSNYTSPDADNSTWDQGIGTTAFNRFQTAGADWIWNEAPISLANQISGQVVYFKQALNVPGLPVGSADLYITADNAFKAQLDGSTLGQMRLGPGFPGTLREDVGSGPQQGDWGVASQGWQPVSHYTFAVTTGSHTLQVTAANEYMANGSDGINTADHYLGWNGSAYTSTVFNDPQPTLINCFNPGAVIFMAQVHYLAQSDTAWTDTMPFGGKNWGTYFTYTLTA